MNQPTDPTFIVTTEIDAESFAWLDDLRRMHFPPERNVLSAHLTMFHRLVPNHIDRLLAVPLPSHPIAIEFSSIMFLGAANAIKATSNQLERLRQNLKDAMGDGLSPQDNQRWSPHVTVQNKVSPKKARDLFRMLDRDFKPRDGQAQGLLIWEYLSGPWKLTNRLPFESQ